MGRGTDQVPKQVHSGCLSDTYDGLFLLPLFWNKLTPGGVLPKPGLKTDASPGVQGSTSLPKLSVSTAVLLDEIVLLPCMQESPTPSQFWGKDVATKLRLQRKIKIVPIMLLFSRTGVWLHSDQPLLR